MLGDSLAVRWLGFLAFTAEDPGLIPARAARIPQAVWCGQKKKKKKSEAILLTVWTLAMDFYITDPTYPWQQHCEIGLQPPFYR